MGEKMTEARKLTVTQKAVLEVAETRANLGWKIDYYRAAEVGGNGRTLDALTRFGYLEKGAFVAGASVWSITDAGRAALRP